MRIALLTDSDVFAGTERHMLDLAIELRAAGADPTLICPSAGVLAQRGRALQIEVLPLEKGGAFDWQAIRQLRLWFGSRFDLIHAHNGRTALLAAAAKIFHQPGALVATQHFLSPARATRGGLKGTLGKFIHLQANRKISRVIAISKAVADALLKRRECPPEKVRVILNGIRDPQALPLTAPNKMRDQFGIAADVPLIVCLARLDREKGVDLLIEAMAEVALAIPDACCVVAGRGDLEEELRAKLAAMKPAPPVKLAGFIEDSLSLVNAADLFVLPSLAEPFGLSIVEAMALGKPVVTTAAGGPLEIILNHETGILVPPGEVRPLAEAIISILSDPEKARKMGLRSRQDFVARFTAARMAKEMLAVYSEAVAANAAPAKR